MSEIKHHTDLLNALILKYGLKSYLEIGVQNPANNYDKIICDYKDGCDPDLTMPDAKEQTIARYDSDTYFTKMAASNWLPTFDLIFIDGLHHADQVKRDFENSLRCLSDNGFIVIHDVLPDEEQYTQVPRSTKKWFGNVYQFAMTMNQYEGIGFVTFNIDCGCMLVWKIKDKQPVSSLGHLMNWETYKDIGNVLLNIVDDVKI